MIGILIALPVIGAALKIFGVSFEKIAKGYLYLALFSVVIVAPSTFFPFIGGKDFFFRVCIDLAVATFFLWWGFEARRKELKERVKAIVTKPLFIAVSFFVLAFLLASAFALDPHAAFWSNFERGEGGFEMLHYYAFFFLLLLLFREQVDWELALGTSLTAAILLILYGLAALFKMQYFIGPDLCARFQGSLGNPAYVAPYLMFAMFYVLYRWFVDSGKKISGRAILISGLPTFILFLLLVIVNSSFLPQFVAGIFAPYVSYAAAHPSLNLLLTIIIYAIFPTLYGMYLRKKGASRFEILKGVVYASLIAIFLFFFLLTQTRGAFLGLGVGIAAGIGYALFLEFHKRTKKVLLATLAFLLLVGGLAYYYRQHDIPLVPFCASSSRLVNLDLEEQTAQTRFWTWGSAIQGWQERPIFGWGPENFSVVFDKYFNERHFIPNQNSETWFDRAHGVVFDYLAETGVVGFLAYVSMFIAFYLQLLWFKKRATEKHQGGETAPHARELGSMPFIKILFFTLPIVYLVQGLVLFDVLPIYLNVFLFLAFSIFLFSKPKVTQHERHA